MNKKSLRKITWNGFVKEYSVSSFSGKSTLVLDVISAHSMSQLPSVFYEKGGKRIVDIALKFENEYFTKLITSGLVYKLKLSAKQKDRLITDIFLRIKNSNSTWFKNELIAYLRQMGYDTFKCLSVLYDYYDDVKKKNDILLLSSKVLSEIEYNNYQKPKVRNFVNKIIDDALKRRGDIQIALNFISKMSKAKVLSDEGFDYLIKLSYNVIGKDSITKTIVSILANLINDKRMKYKQKIEILLHMVRIVTSDRAEDDFPEVYICEDESFYEFTHDENMISEILPYALKIIKDIVLTERKCPGDLANSIFDKMYNKWEKFVDYEDIQGPMNINLFSETLGEMAVLDKLQQKKKVLLLKEMIKRADDVPVVCSLAGMLEYFNPKSEEEYMLLKSLAEKLITLYLRRVKGGSEEDIPLARLYSRLIKLPKIAYKINESEQLKQDMLSSIIFSLNRGNLIAVGVIESILTEGSITKDIKVKIEENLQRFRKDYV